MEQSIATFTFDRVLEILGLLIGVVGIPLTCIFYIKSKRQAQPWVSAHPLSVRIVDTAQTALPGLEVRHNGQLVTGQNITASTIFFGNRGNSEIQAEDVLTPLAVVVPPQVTILDARIIKASRTVCGFYLESFANDSPEIRVHFRVVERYDGCRLQLIHTGSVSPNFKIVGEFIGCKLRSRAFSNIGDISSTRTEKIVILITFVAVTSFSGVLLNYVDKLKHHYHWSIWVSIATIIVILAAGTTLPWYILDLVITHPQIKKRNLELLMSNEDENDL